MRMTGTQTENDPEKRFVRNIYHLDNDNGNGVMRRDRLILAPNDVNECKCSCLTDEGSTTIGILRTAQDVMY